MIIHMVHPLHGEMDVYTEAEVTANEKNGWKRVIKQEIPAVETIHINTGVQSVNTLSLHEQYQAKFGKKPHHRMNQSTIEAALKE